DGNIYWYSNNGDGTVWTPHLIPGAQGDLSVWIADMNGDGHNDLILPYKNTITWWENVKGDGTEWKAHLISDQVSLPPPPPPETPSSTPINNTSNSGTNSGANGGGSSLGSPLVGSQGAYDAVAGTKMYALSVSLQATSGLAVSVIHGGINILSV